MNHLMLVLSTSLQDILSEMSLLGKTLQEEREQNEVTSSRKGLILMISFWTLK